MDMQDVKALSPECLVFYFTRSYNDVETTYAQEVVYFSPDDECNYEDASKDSNYRQVVFQEYIRIVVDDLQIVDWLWVYPKEEVEMIMPNVTLLSLDKIKDIFTQQAVNEFSYINEVV